LVLVDVAPRRPVLRKDQQPCDGGWIPSEALSGDPGSEANFRVVSSQRLLDRRELGLELDYQERARRFVPGKQVDRAAFAIDRIRHFRLDRPASFHESFDHCLSQRCVPSIEQVVERSTSPSDDDNDLRVKHTEETAETPQRHAFDPAAFQERDFVLTARGLACDVLLAQPESLAEDTRDPSDSEVVHGPTMASGA
jgi:hypothetical protein